MSWNACEERFLNWSVKTVSSGSFLRSCSHYVSICAWPVWKLAQVFRSWIPRRWRYLKTQEFTLTKSLPVWPSAAKLPRLVLGLQIAFDFQWPRWATQSHAHSWKCGWSHTRSAGGSQTLWQTIRWQRLHFQNTSAGTTSDIECTIVTDIRPIWKTCSCSWWIKSYSANVPSWKRSLTSSRTYPRLSTPVKEALLPNHRCHVNFLVNLIWGLMLIAISPRNHLLVSALRLLWLSNPNSR